MNNYEGMFLVDSKLDEKAAKAVFDQINETIKKNEGNINSSGIWAQKHSLAFPIKKRHEATYYLVNFKLNPSLIDKIQQAYRLSENILRVLITRSNDPAKGGGI